MDKTRCDVVIPFLDLAVTLEQSLGYSPSQRMILQFKKTIDELLVTYLPRMASVYRRANKLRKRRKR